MLRKSDKLLALGLILMLFGLFACTARTSMKPDHKFIGRWELSGRKMLDGIQVDIQREEGELVGRIVRLNDNKYVRMFVDSNSVLVSGISRTSNFQFKLTENKVAKELFSTYDLPGSQEFNVEFINDQTIGLSKGNANPLKSTVVYKRVQ